MGRWILGLLLVAMALGQLSDPAGFVDIVETYDLGGRGLAWLIAGLVFVGEAIGGALLLVPAATDAGRRRQRRGAAVALVVAIGWSILAVQAFARGLDVPNCGCFGVHLGQRLRWWILLEDLEFMALAWWVGRKLGPEARASDVTPQPVPTSTG